MSAIEVFFSYSHNDENLSLELETHLKVLQRQGVIKAWNDRRISAGSEWEKQIHLNLQRAQIILLLVSADFIASDYCLDVEVSQAMERHRTGDSIVVPVILRPCDWESMPFGKLQAVPKGARPVTSWENRDEAFADIAITIRQIAEELQKKTSIGVSDPGPASQLEKTRNNSNALAGSIRKLGFPHAIRDTLFRSKTSRYLFAFTIAILFIFLFYGFSAHLIIIRSLEKADYSSANWHLEFARLTAFYNRKISEILESLNRPLAMQAQLIVKNPNGLKWEYPGELNNFEKVKITPKDDYRISVTLKQGSAYLYVFQTDPYYGRIQQFFPNPEFSEKSNPIQNDFTYNIPSAHWFYLDKHIDESIPDTIKNIHVIGSPWRARDIEHLYEEIYHAVNGTDTALEERKALIENFIARLSLRKKSNINSVLYREFSLLHGN